MAATIQNTAERGLSGVSGHDHRRAKGAKKAGLDLGTFTRPHGHFAVNYRLLRITSTSVDLPDTNDT